MPPPKSPQPTLCLDSGGVLTVQRSGGEKHDGDTIWKATMPGAYALVQLFQYHHGPDSVCVVSRVNRIPADSARHRHWVERHAVSVGVLWRHIYLCTELEEKRKHVREAKGTVMVDDRLDALYAMSQGGNDAGTAQKAIHFGGAEQPRNWPFDDHKAEAVQSHYEIAKMLGLVEDKELFNWLCEQGPPNCPHSVTIQEEIYKRLRGQDRRGGHAPDGDSGKDNKNDEDDGEGPWMRQRSRRSRRREKDNENAAEAATPPSSYKWQPAGHGLYKQGDDKLTVEAQLETAAPKSQAKPDVVKRELVEDGERQGDASRRRMAAEKQGSLQGKAAAEHDDDDDEESSSNVHARLQRLEERFDEVKDENRRWRDYYGAWQTQNASAGGWYYPWQWARPAAPEPVWNQRHPGSAWAQPAAPEPTPAPVWNHRHPGSAWAQNKLRRAAEYQARGGRRDAPRQHSLPMCALCQTSQPGAFCPRRRCRRCCTDRACPQHHG